MAVAFWGMVDPRSGAGRNLGVVGWASGGKCSVLFNCAFLKDAPRTLDDLGEQSQRCLVLQHLGGWSFFVFLQGFARHGHVWVWLDTCNFIGFAEGLLLRVFDFSL